MQLIIFRANKECSVSEWRGIPFLDRGVRLADFISHNYTFRVHTSCWTGTPSSRQWIYSLCVSVHGFVRRGCICLCECIHASSGGMHYVSGVLCTHGISLCPGNTKTQRRVVSFRVIKCIHSTSRGVRTMFSLVAITSPSLV